MPHKHNSKDLSKGEDVPLVEFKYLVFTQRMYLWWSLCTLYLLPCQVRVTVGDSGLCCCVCVRLYTWHTDTGVLSSAHSAGMTVCLRNNGEPSPCHHKQSSDLLTLRCSPLEAGRQTQAVKTCWLCASSDVADGQKPVWRTQAAAVLHLAEAILCARPNSNALETAKQNILFTHCLGCLLQSTNKHLLCMNITSEINLALRMQVT